MAIRGEVAFRAEVASALVSSDCVPRAEVHLFLYVCSVSADSLRCDFDKEGIRPFDFEEASLCVILSQPVPCYAPETHYPASSLLGLQRKVS